MSNAIELIKEQQKKLRETDPAYMIGLQLIDMIREVKNARSSMCWQRMMCFGDGSRYLNGCLSRP